MKGHTPLKNKKQRQKILNEAQACELKWFCNNVTGLRQEYYAALEKLGALGARLGRLEKTVDMIENFLNEMSSHDNDEGSEGGHDTTRGGPGAASSAPNAGHADTVSAAGGACGELPTG